MNAWRIGLVLLAVVALGSEGSARQYPGSDSGSSPSGAREGVPTAQRVFVETVQVHVVNVDVFVSDRRGRPVTGLQREDFELLLDDRPIEISNFFAAVGDELVEDEGASPIGSTVPETMPTPEEPPLLSVRDENRLNLAVVVDLERGSPSERATAISHVQNIVKNDLPAGTRLMAATVDRRISIRQTLTAEPSAVVDVLEGIKTKVGGGPLATAAARHLVNQIERARESGIRDHEAARLLEDVRSFAEQGRMRAQSAARELANFVDVLAGLPGRKIVLYLSGGMPVREGEAMFEALTLAFPDLLGSLSDTHLSPILEAMQFDASPELENVVRRANAGRVVFFPVDVSSTQPGTEVDAGTLSTLVRDTAGTRWRDAMSGLVRMAGGTGGRTLVSGPESILGAAELLQEMGTYYSLGFEPSRRDVGRHRRIEVRVRGRNLQVRYPERVLIKSPEERLGDRVTAGLHLGGAGNPLEVRLLAAGPPQRRGRQVELPLQVVVPASRLALMRLEDSFRGRFTVVLRVRDSSGASSGIHQESVDLAVPADRIDADPDTPLIYQMRLRLRRGQATIAALVHDELAGSSSVATLEVDTGAGST